MSLLRGVLSQVLSWTGLWQLMVLVGAGLGAVVSVWTVKLLVCHAWFTHRLSCFSKPHAGCWATFYAVRCSALSVLLLMLCVAVVTVTLRTRTRDT